MAKRKPKSKVYTVRDASGEQLSQRFSSKEDARKWQESIRRQRQLVKAGLELPVEYAKMTVKDYAKIFMTRRAKGQVIGNARGRKRKPVVKGTWIHDGQRLQDYVLPEVGSWFMHAVSPEKWEEVFEKAKNRPVAVMRWEEHVARHKERVAENERRIKEGKKPKTFSNYRIPPAEPPKSQLSEASVNRLRAVVHRMYEDAIAERIVSRNPIAQVAVRDEGPADQKSDFWETKEECVAYLEEALADGPREFFFAVWNLNLGCRVNELTALQHGDLNLTAMIGTISKIVDPKDGFAVRERTKGKKSRTFGINQAMHDAYLRLLDSTPYKAPTDFVLYRDAAEGEPARPMSSYTLYKQHIDRCKRAGIRVIRVHDMRHCYASHFMMAGGNLRDLSERLGHANITTTMRYSHLSPEHLKKQAGVFEVTVTETKDNVRALKK